MFERITLKEPHCDCLSLQRPANRRRAVIRGRKRLRCRRKTPARARPKIGFRKCSRRCSRSIPSRCSPRDQATTFLFDGGGKEGANLKSKHRERPGESTARPDFCTPAMTMGVLADLLAHCRVPGHGQHRAARRFRGRPEVDPDEATIPGPDVFAALEEQLGLKLVPGKSHC